MARTREDIVAEIVGKGAAHAAQHMAAGGILGDTEAVLTGGASATPFGSKILSNPAGALTPQDNYQASAPAINQNNYQPEVASGETQLNESNSQLNGTSANLQGLAGNQAAAANQQAGVASQQQALANQQGSLGQQLLAQSQGAGPNPAQAQEQQNVQANTAQTAGTIASEKGLSPGLAARLMAEQQSAGAQNAAGGAATLQAQQQLAAESALQGQQAAQGNTLAAQGNTYANQVAGLGAAASTTNADANLQEAQGQLGLGQLTEGANANNAQNNTITSGVNGANSINAAGAAANAGATQKTMGGLLNGGAGAAGTMANGGSGGDALLAAAGYDGGEADHIKHVPLVKQPASAVAAQANPTLAQHLMNQGGQVPGTPEIKHNDIKNDVVPAVLSKKEIVLPLDVTMAKDAPARAAAFVEHLKKKTQPGYHQVIAARAKKKA